MRQPGRQAVTPEQAFASAACRAKEDPAAEPGLLQRRLDCVLALSGQWFWEQDEDYRFTLVKGPPAAQTRLDLQHLVGKKLWQVAASPVNDNGRWDKHQATLAARQPYADFLVRHLDASGQPYF